MSQVTDKTLEMNVIHSSANLSGEMNNYSILLINFQVKKLVIIS